MIKEPHIRIFQLFCFIFIHTFIHSQDYIEFNFLNDNRENIFIKLSKKDHSLSFIEYQFQPDSIFYGRYNYKDLKQNLKEFRISYQFDTILNEKDFKAINKRCKIIYALKKTQKNIYGSHSCNIFLELNSKLFTVNLSDFHPFSINNITKKIGSKNPKIRKNKYKLYTDIYKIIVKYSNPKIKNNENCFWAFNQ